MLYLLSRLLFELRIILSMTTFYRFFHIHTLYIVTQIFIIVCVRIFRTISMRGMSDLQNELKVADEFWDFLGGQGAYLQLLDIFERVGIELRPEIDNYFTEYNRP